MYRVLTYISKYYVFLLYVTYTGLGFELEDPGYTIRATRPFQGYSRTVDGSGRRCLCDRRSFSV